MNYEMNYVILIIFWLLIDTDCVFARFLLFLSVSCIFRYSILCVWFYNKINLPLLCRRLGFFSVFCAAHWDHFLHGVILHFCSVSLADPFRLSVPVPMIEWKDSSSKWPIMCWWNSMGTMKLTHSLTCAGCFNILLFRCCFSGSDRVVMLPCQCVCLITQRAKLSTLVYCYRSCLWQAGGVFLGVFVGLLPR